MSVLPIVPKICKLPCNLCASVNYKTIYIPGVVVLVRSFPDDAELLGPGAVRVVVQHVLAQQHGHQVLPHAVGGRHHVPGGHQRAPAQVVDAPRLRVGVTDGDLPVEVSTGLCDI